MLGNRIEKIMLPIEKNSEGKKNYMERQKGRTADMHLSTEQPK